VGIVDPINPPAGVIMQRQAVFDSVRPVPRCRDFPRLDFHRVSRRKLKFQTVQAEKERQIMIGIGHS
jgi:hypothetical protein